MSFLQSLRNFVSHATAPLRPAVAHCEAAPAAAPAAAGDAESAADLPDSFVVYQVLGFRECPWFHRAACIASDLGQQPEHENTVEISILPVERHRFPEMLAQVQQLSPEAASHNSCPAILSTRCYRDEHTEATPEGMKYQCDQPSFIGGYTELERHLATQYSFTSQRCAVFSRAMGGANSGACN